MIYINRNKSITQLREIIDSSFNNPIGYMPKDFNREQNHALKLLKERVFLEETVEEAIAFNKQLNWEETHSNLKLVTTAEQLVQVFKLRSDVYSDLGYQEEFPDTIQGLNFDKYDKNAAILYYESESHITGTTRLIFDSLNKLPSEGKFSFDDMRNKYGVIGELSRLIIRNEKKGLNLEFKYLMQGIHTLFKNNKIDITLLAIIQEHYKLYTKFGGSEIIAEIDDFGNMEHSIYLLSWDPSLVSNFFKKVFLKS